MGVPGKPVPDKERLQMFVYFLQGQDRAEIARMFNRNPNTVGEIAKEDEWEKKKALVHKGKLNKATCRAGLQHEEIIKSLIWMKDALLTEAKDEWNTKKGKGTGVAPTKRLKEIRQTLELLYKMLGLDKEEEPPGAPGQGMHFHGPTQLVINVGGEAKEADKMSPEELEAMERQLVDEAGEPEGEGEGE